jgi:hypothetical protein
MTESIVFLKIKAEQGDEKSSLTFCYITLY